MRRVQGPVHARVNKPQGEAAEYGEVAKPLIAARLGDRDRQGHDQRSKPTVSSVVSATATPAGLKLSFFLFALPALPEIFAPAGSLPFAARAGRTAREA